MENLCDTLDDLMSNESGLMDYEYEGAYRQDILNACWFDLSEDQRKYLCGLMGFDYELQKEQRK